jgi:hypothetical protein
VPVLYFIMMHTHTHMHDFHVLLIGLKDLILGTHLLVQLSIFLIDLFVGTYRLSSHARLEAFVQTKLNKLNIGYRDH